MNMKKINKSSIIQNKKIVEPLVNNFKESSQIKTKTKENIKENIKENKNKYNDMFLL